MRLTTVSRATGMRLARDLPATGPGRVPLLAHGTVLTERYQRALLAQGIHAVWVDDELSDGIEPVELMSETVRAETAERVRGALDSARAAFGSSQRLPPATLQDLSGIVDRIASSIMDNADAALVLNDLAAADQYTHRHSVNVTALGLLIGRAYWRTEGWIDYRGARRWDRIDERLAKLGMGLLLHDIGKMVVPAEVLNKPGKLDDEEWALIKTHPDAGVALLDAATISPLVRSVVRDHHERWDGSGYPRGLTADRIGELPRVAAIADVFDAVTSQRPYAPAEPPHVGVKIIDGGAGAAFDPLIVTAFRKVVMPYPVGTEVQLPDGRTGVVAHVETTRPYEPVVRVAGEDVQVDMRIAAA